MMAQFLGGELCHNFFGHSLKRSRDGNAHLGGGSNGVTEAKIWNLHRYWIAYGTAETYNILGMVCM